MIYFNSGNSRKTAYIFNEAIHTKNKITFLGLNEKLGLDKQFRIIGTIKDKTYFTESFNVTLK